MRRLKLISYALLFFLAITSLSPAMAQAPDASSSSTTPAATQNKTVSAPTQSNTSPLNVVYGNVDQNVPRNLSTLTQGTLISVLSSAVCMLSGTDPLNPDGRCLGVNPKTGKIGYAQKGEGGIQVMGGLIGGAFSIPISSSDYASYALENFGLTKKAYAQASKNETQFGIGYNRLKPLVAIWSRFRDIAYLGFVLAFTVIGLAIMFRVKIDARTVMTIQNQIPKIVIALIMVTLSYAIAGFLIDLMYVVMYLVILTFSTLTPTNVNPNATVFGVVNSAFSVGYNTPVSTGHIPGIIGLTGELSWPIAKVMGNLATDFLSSTISAIFETLFSPFQAISDIGCSVFSLFTSPIAGLGSIIGGVLGFVPGIGGIFGGGGSCNFLETFFRTIISAIFLILAYLIILIAILFSLFRVWFTLIKSFAYVLIDSMIAPLWIASGIFPGSKLGFTSWLRHLMGHLSVFPMTFAVIFLGKTMIDAVNSSNGQLFSPPLIGDAIGGSSVVAAFIGLGFIISLHSILDKTRKFVGAFDFGLADIKASFGAGVGTTRNAISTTVQSRTKTSTPGQAPGFWKTIGGKL